MIFFFSIEQNEQDISISWAGELFTVIYIMLTCKQVLWGGYVSPRPVREETNTMTQDSHARMCNLTTCGNSGLSSRLNFKQSMMSLFMDLGEVLYSLLRSGDK